MRLAVSSVKNRKIMDKNIVAIIQARMGSSRLPGKVLKDICGHPMLAHVVNRIKPSTLLAQTVVATTCDDNDLPIVDFCATNQIHCFCGSQFDVLDRYYHAACETKADIIVRLTADCPLLDGALIDQVVYAFLDQNVDFAANRLPPPWKRSYPIGLDVEVCSFAALERAWQKAESQYEREHVMPYLYNQPGRFKTLLLQHHPDLGSRRWTVDTSQDLELMQKIFEHFQPQLDFSWNAVRLFLDENSELEKLNQGITHKSVTEIDERFAR